MFIKSIWIGFIGVMLFVASASAAGPGLPGIVKDAKGHAIGGADIRIEATNTGRLLTTVKTNVDGRYSIESRGGQLPGDTGCEWCREGLHQQYDSRTR